MQIFNTDRIGIEIVTFKIEITQNKSIKLKRIFY
jgi:hypothetical protein